MADNARRFLRDIAGRLTFPTRTPAIRTIQAGQLSSHRTDLHRCFAGYREAVDLAFGPYAKFGTIIKEYRNANMIYTPSEMVGTKARDTGNRRRKSGTIRTKPCRAIERYAAAIPKRLNRLTYCFSKKLENLEAAFAMFAAYYNYCWQTRMPGKSGKKRPPVP